TAVAAAAKTPEAADDAPAVPVSPTAPAAAAPSVVTPTGPVPSPVAEVDAVPDDDGDSDGPRRLPRRVSPRESAANVTPVVAEARPLRRRVRGATLRKSGVDTAERPVSRQAAPTVDADEVRAALEEFEAAVERANRDSNDNGGHEDQAVPSTTPRTHNQNDLPEGAQQ
ncbi:histidine kinase, partial [Streptomyces chartreusis]